MKEASRTKRTLQNSQVSLILFVIQIFVGFYSRKVFLDELSAEVIGLNTTLGNILSFLNLAELGIGIAMATSLYKPINANDKEGICEILTVQGILYKRIAMILCALAAVVMVAMPWIFPNTECGLPYVYVAFLVFLSGSLASYLWNYREVLIGADQKNFKLMPWIHGIRYVKVGLQIFFLLVINLGIWGWIALEFLASVASVFAINHVIKKEYPWLHKVKTPAKELLSKYSDLMTKTKQLFVHKIGSFVLEQTAPLIIYALVSLVMVTYYGNYMLIIGYVATLLNVVFEGMGASIGNLVAENNKKHTLEVFWELFTARLFIAALACYCIYVFMEPFIILWIGEQYVLPTSTLLLMIMGVFIRMTRSVVDSFKNAYQLFADVWSPIVEACLNLGCSLLFGYFWGLNGILLGANISLIVIVLIWKPYYTFREGLKSSSAVYFAQYALHLAVLVGVAVGASALMMWLDSKTDNIWLSLVYRAATVIVYAIAVYAILMAVTPGMRKFTQRIINILHRRL